MYINIPNLLSLKHFSALPLLLILKQASKKDLSIEIESLDTCEKILRKLEEDNFIKFIKGKKSDTIFQRMRLDKKGTKYLNELDEPQVLEEDVIVFDWLKNLYKGMDKEIGNGKRTQRHIASFREKSGIEKNDLIFLCKTFVNDEYEQDWSFRLEYVFYKPKSAFNTRFILEDSRLWQYFKKKEDRFNREFKKLK